MGVNLLSTIKLNRQCNLRHLSRNLKGGTHYKNRCTIWFNHSDTWCLSNTSMRTMQNDPIKNLSQIMSFRFQSTVKATETSKKSIESSDAPEQVVVDTKEPTRTEKLKKAVKEYGSTVIVFHVGISLISLGSCYLLISAGLDTAVVFETLGLQDWLAKSQIAANAGTFAVAYAIHKVFAPVRITITLASVPFIVRYLRKIGFLKK